ncbi:MAG: 7-carboxy-7-deazaguanine synthase QueE [Deltaproteobacteria bacterium]|nr:MAG: 7-carboxy-7-deazaguanine synthase QueE [Deltaproteobacteria bacterium]
MLNLSEIFYSLQGESTFAGLPCLFVRLAGCNLNCAYCDTGYARSVDGGEEVSVAEIIDRVSAYKVSLVEITGGEPLLQKETAQLVKELLKLNFTVLIETNGSLSIAGFDPCVFFIIDVKTPGSKVSAGFNFANLELLQAHHQLKFVMVDEADFFWSLDFIAEHKSEIGRLETIFSPVTKSFAPERLAELMLAHRVSARLQLQLHTLLWPECVRGR